MKKDTIIIAGRKTPVAAIEAYIRHLRTHRIVDVQAFEWERSRLHNAIFNAVGLVNLGPGSDNTARQLGYFAESLGKSSPDDMFEVRGVDVRPYGAFNSALEDLLCRVLACPKCGITLQRDLSCRKCEIQVTVEDHIEVLRHLAKTQKVANDLMGGK